MVPAKSTLVLSIPLDPKLPTKARRIVFSHGDPDHGMEANREWREREKWQHCEHRLFSQEQVVFPAQDLERDEDRQGARPELSTGGYINNPPSSLRHITCNQLLSIISIGHPTVPLAFHHTYTRL